MSIMELGALGEFVGSIAVIATLAYLAVQIRQNTRQARLGSIQAVNASNDSAFEPIYIPENTRIFTTGLDDPDALTSSERRVFDMLMARLVACFDTTTYQHEHGAYDAEIYAGTAAFYASWVATPGGREWWLRHREMFSLPTRTYLDGAVAAIGDG